MKGGMIASAKGRLPLPIGVLQTEWVNSPLVKSECISAVNVIPFGLALIASRAGSRRAASWTALGFNALWTLL